MFYHFIKQCGQIGPCISIGCFWRVPIDFEDKYEYPMLDQQGAEAHEAFWTCCVLRSHINETGTWFIHRCCPL